ncbi:MAG: hypothetical protein MZV65_37325 [Chromatiales bacterium]|nr:hypothetical protein [Chromatiales bacterium]
MNWSVFSGLTPVKIGLFLTLMIVALHPFFGPRLPSALLLLLGAWLVWQERGALFAVRAQRRWVVVCLLLFVPVLISVPGSISLRHSAGVAGAVVLYFFVGVAMLRSLRADRDRYWLAKWIGVVLVFWLVDSLIQYVVGRDLFGIPLTSDGRILGPFPGHIFMPVLLLYLMPLLLWVLMPRNLALAVLAFLAVSLVSMMSGARTVLVWSYGGGRRFPAAMATRALEVAGRRIRGVVAGVGGDSGGVRVAGTATAYGTPRRSARTELRDHQPGSEPALDYMAHGRKYAGRSAVNRSWRRRVCGCL